MKWCESLKTKEQGQSQLAFKAEMKARTTVIIVDEWIEACSNSTKSKRKQSLTRDKGNKRIKKGGAGEKKKRNEGSNYVN